MCFSSPKPPDVKEPPKADPTPQNVEGKESGVNSMEDRRKKLRNMRMGLASTMKSQQSESILAAPSLVGKERLGQ